MEVNELFSECIRLDYLWIALDSEVPRRTSVGKKPYGAVLCGGDTTQKMGLVQICCMHEGAIIEFGRFRV